MDEEHLVETLRRKAKKIYQANVSASEEASWRASPKTVARILERVGLGEVMVLLEMSTLSSDARIDMLLVGSHPRSGELSVVAVENKQWSWATFDSNLERVRHPGANKREGSQHPAEQIWDYCNALDRYLPMLCGQLHGVVNLHNAPTGKIKTILPARCKLRADVRGIEIFGSDDQARARFAAFLVGILCAKGAKSYVRDIDRAHVRPSDDFMREVDQAVRLRSIFPLLDEQRKVVDMVFQAVDSKFSEDNKQVFIVTGGPGTGKSVLGVELLGMLSRAGSSVVHASSSNAFTGALRRHVKGRRSSVSEVFTFFHHHRRRKPNQLNVLICDEAHRMRKTSNLQRTPREERSDTPQLHELIRAARVPVFLLDPQQWVVKDEVSAPDKIREAALELGITADRIHCISLGRQFRHDLFPGYVDWVEDLLGYNKGPSPWTYRGEFRLYRANTPGEMEEYLRLQKLVGCSARITAGLCWDWTKEYVNGKLVDDIIIDDWKKPWNAARGNRRKGVPAAESWATDVEGFEQVGCIYTAQGFEWDYAGVIMGYDYTWQGDRWVTVKNKDSNTRSVERRFIVPNVYRVLATRGRRGMVLYSTDANTRQLFADLGVPPLGPALEELRKRHRPAGPSFGVQGEIF
ncbi:DNA/RNA helicase domain-containing protein [Actinomadura sp. WMMB 499]|uniref:DNA/RNA helicase domain-containing protein n=1 Tax=Actinomadura sp. WMMB 499 TaxID=1219491 RepID=UPI00159EAEC6|nr:DNA/RNA helicase domain-containing protein [Actinomadura sp. WMMB 499]